MKIRNGWQWMAMAGLAVVGLLVPAGAEAWTIDLPAGTGITNSCTISWGAISVSDSVSLGADTQVVAIYGDTLQKPAEAGQANVSETTVFAYSITNTGNQTDSYYVSFAQAPIYDGGSSNWVFQLGNGTDTLTYGYGGTPGPSDSITIGPVTEDGIGAVYVAVQASAVPAEAPDGSLGGCSFTVNAYSNAMGYPATASYTGDNGYAYAESVASAGANNFGNDVITIASAIFSVTKNCTATLGGADWTPVPGASLGFTIGYSNSGTGSGQNVSLYDQIDTNVIQFQASAALAAGWTFQVGPADVTDFSYGSGQFVAEGAIPAAAVRWIRWTKASVAAAESGSQTYRTTIY